MRTGKRCIYYWDNLKQYLKVVEYLKEKGMGRPHPLSIDGLFTNKGGYYRYIGETFEGYGSLDYMNAEYSKSENSEYDLIHANKFIEIVPIELFKI